MLKPNCDDVRYESDVSPALVQVKSWEPTFTESCELNLGEHRSSKICITNTTHPPMFISLITIVEIVVTGIARLGEFSWRCRIAEERSF
jgi:hypothetical protein